jgi:squalene synthase HpnC
VRTVPPEVPAIGEILGPSGRRIYLLPSLLFAPGLRPHVISIYGFGKLVDTLGDEAAGDRIALLDWTSSELDAIYRSQAPAHPIMQRLGRTVRHFDLPRAPFDRLVMANRIDQSTHRYETFGGLLGYCDLAANPIGELLLLVHEVATPERVALSNAACTGLQLTDFLYDLDEDAARGRVYVPSEDMARFDYGFGDLLAGVRGDRFEALMRFEAERARAMLGTGLRLAHTLPARAALAARAMVSAGLAVVEDLERSRFDRSRRPPITSGIRRAWFAVRELATPDS